MYHSGGGGGGLFVMPCQAECMIIEETQKSQILMATVDALYHRQARNNILKVGEYLTYNFGILLTQHISDPFSLLFFVPYVLLFFVSSSWVNGAWT